MIVVLLLYTQILLKFKICFKFHCTSSLSVHVKLEVEHGADGLAARQGGSCDSESFRLSLQVKETLVCTTFTSGSTRSTRSTRGSTTASPRPPSPSWCLGLLRSCGSRSSWGGRRWGPRGDERVAHVTNPYDCLTPTDGITPALCSVFLLKASPPAPCILASLALPRR